ncbi:hypothetical protein HK101_010338, partial [Irineochytrium annulatum]
MKVLDAKNATVPFPAPNTTYSIEVQIIYANGTSCTPCSTELSNLGGFPVLKLDLLQRSLSSADTIPQSSTSWRFRITTGDAGLVMMAVDSNGCRTDRMSLGGIKAQDFVVGVGAFGGVLKETPPSVGAVSAVLAAADPSNVTLVRVEGASEALVMTLPGVTSVAGHGGQAALVQYPSLNMTWLDVTVADQDACKLGGGFNGTWINLVPSCIESAYYPTMQPPFNDVGCLNVLAVGGGADAGRVWMIYPDAGVDDASAAVELLDSRKRTMAAALGMRVVDFTVVSAAMTSTECWNALVLIKGKAGYQIVQWTRDEEHAVDGSQFFRIFNATTNIANATTSLNLDGMSFHRSLGNDLFIYGNALFF